ncbi:hypothetical protein EVAR_30647_1 [Eumeta japonica]|uniref:Uncharacterized protein n=1 Tax=Eumeta variegata TaxID=151549 RepID=A0A4C1VSN4_EUMVA|nr:hypothetical protein EVAR_30647_1 [Eumeta japonica]
MVSRCRSALFCIQTSIVNHKLVARRGAAASSFTDAKRFATANLSVVKGKDKTANAGGDGFRPVPLASVNPWFKKKEPQQAKKTT